MGYLGIVIFIVFLIAYFRKRHTNLQEQAEEHFWDRENRANSTRRQDINGLPYINIPLEKFPIDICSDPGLKEAESILSTLAAQKILNLGNQTNTDLKLKYGPANLEALTEYDQNFVVLCRTLVSYAEHLIRLGYEAEARDVLEFGISCGSDASKNFLLLADLYVKNNETELLHDLREKAAALNSPMKASILKRLDELTVVSG